MTAPLLSAAEAAPAAEVGQAVVAAWMEGTGWLLDLDEDRLARLEMTLRLIPRITEVARWALDAPAVVPVLSSLAETVSALAWRLMHFAWQMRPDIAFPLNEVLAWIEMVAGAPGTRSVAVVADLGVEATETFEWRTAGLPPGAAPLAHAAGLTRTEVVAQHRAGLLDPAGLRLFATLRGWRFPPSP